MSAENNINKEFCVWTQENYESDSFRTSCGVEFVYIDDGGALIDESFNYCCYCGKKMRAEACNNDECEVESDN